MENRLLALSDLTVGQCGHIKSIQISGAMRRRLQDIGLINGTQIRCCRVHPSGDAAIFAFRGTQVALRRQDTAQILVELL